MRNTIFVHGHVGRIDEPKQIGENTVTSFTVAERMGKDDTQWHNVQAWGKKSELVTAYVKKGDKIAVKGCLKIRQYTDKDGNKRTAYTIDLEDIELSGKRDESAPTQHPTSSTPTAEQQNLMSQLAGDEEQTDDLPF